MQIEIIKCRLSDGFFARPAGCIGTFGGVRVGGESFSWHVVWGYTAKEALKRFWDEHPSLRAATEAAS